MHFLDYFLLYALGIIGMFAYLKPQNDARDTLNFLACILWPIGVCIYILWIGYGILRDWLHGWTGI